MKLKARKENIAEQTAGDETMIYDLSSDRAYLLNATLAFVWQRCDGTSDLSEISHALAEKNKQPVNEEIVKLAVDQLKDLNLMSEDAPKYFSKITRRKAIRQIGLASMIALPVVFSLTTPTSANAASRGCRMTGVCYPAGTVYCLPGCSGFHGISAFYPGDTSCASPPYFDGSLNCDDANGGNASTYPFRMTS